MRRILIISVLAFGVLSGMMAPAARASTHTMVLVGSDETDDDDGEDVGVVAPPATAQPAPASSGTAASSSSGGQGSTPAGGVAAGAGGTATHGAGNADPLLAAGLAGIGLLGVSAATKRRLRSQKA